MFMALGRVACRCAISGMLLVACSLSDLDGYSSGSLSPKGDGGIGESDGSISSYAATVLADEPVAWWHLGERSGTIAKDAMATQSGTYVGTITLGAPGAIVGDPDTAATFDGTSAFVRISDAFEFAGTSPFSIEVWMNPTSLAGERRLASRRTTGLRPTGYKLSLDDGSVVFDRWEDGVVIGASAKAPLPGVGRWTHVVATYDGAQLTIFVDGTRAGSAASPDAISAAGTRFVWASTSGEETQYFAGSLDEVALYDRALDAARVTAHTRAAGH